MKLPGASKGTHGGVLVLTMAVTALIGITLTSYLTLVKSASQTSLRSQAWHNTMPVIEAGLQDALAHLKRNGTNQLDADGWRRTGDLYWLRRDLGESFYIVTISNWFNPTSYFPVIESRGFTPAPVRVVSRDYNMFATAGGHGSGNTGMGDAGGRVAAPASAPPAASYLARGVRVTTRREGLFTKGLIAGGDINLFGNIIESDSFDSADPLHSTRGQYDVTKRKHNGDIATNSRLPDAFNAGNASILGRVATGRGGSVDVGSKGAVGDIAWHGDGNTGIQPGWFKDDMDVDFPAVGAPFNEVAATPAPGVVDGVAYDYVLSDGLWELSDLNLGGSQKMIVTGNAVLWVKGTARVEGEAFIEVASSGSLEFYMSGPTALFGGSGLVNSTGLAGNLAYYGLPGNTGMELGGNNVFVGTIYAPDATFALNGSGDGVMDFVGASVTANVVMNGSCRFHYDEALAHSGPTRAYVVTSRNELDPTEVAAVTQDTLGGGAGN